MKKLIGLGFLSLVIILFLVYSGSDSKKSNEAEDNVTNIQITKKEMATKEKPAKKPKPFKPTIKLRLPKPHNMPEVPVDDNKELDKLDIDKYEENQLEIIRSVHTQMLEELAGLPECLEKANNRKEAFSCNDAMLEIAKRMLPADYNETDIDQHDDFDNNFTWNEETKVQMIESIENNLESMQKIKTCLDASENFEESNKCFMSN